MNNASPKIATFSAAIRDKRVEMGIGSTEMASGLGLPPEALGALEAGNWSGFQPGEAYKLAQAISARLGLPLGDYYVDRASFFGGQEAKDARQGDLRRERAVMFLMSAGLVATLAWLLIPAKDISQSAAAESRTMLYSSSVWQKPANGQAYPVLGEVLPESPINADGVLVSLRATDACNASVAMANRSAQNQVLRTSEPWKLRIRGPFALHLDNAGVVAVEVAGRQIHHDVGVGLPWSGSFDENGELAQPVRQARPIRVPAPTIGDMGE